MHKIKDNLEVHGGSDFDTKSNVRRKITQAG